MRRILLMTALAVSLLAPTAAKAQSVYSDFYVIPVASHTPGVGNTLWMSDVAIRNIDANNNLNVQLVFIESGEGNTDNVFALTSDAVPAGSVTVPPNGSSLLKDVLKNYRSLPSAVGAILIGSDRPFAVTSRSYVTRDDGGTIGQTVQPVSNFLENVLSGKTSNSAIAYLPGLINNASYRTNLGFIAGNSGSSGGNVVVSFTLRDFSGAVIGAPRSFTIAPGVFTHLQFSSRTIADKAFDLASAEVQITAGNGVVVPYASVVDNKTADAVFVLAQFPNNTAVGKWGTAPSLLRMLFDQVKTSGVDRRRASSQH